MRPISSVARFLLAAAFLLLTPRASAAATATAPTKLALVKTAAIPKPPPTRVEVVRDTLHGVVIEDPYRWLEDKDSPETRAWLDKQIAYTNGLLGAQPGRAALRARIEQCYKVDVISSEPKERGGRYFYSRRAANQDLFVICMREGLNGPEKVLVDPHGMSADHTTSVTLIDVSQDGKQLIYGTRRGGEDEVTVSILDVDQGKVIADGLPKGRYFGVALTPAGFYYSRYQKEGTRVFYHPFGGDPAKDALVFGEGMGPEKITGVGVSEDGHWLVIQVYHGSAGKQVEVYVKDLVANGPIVTVVNDLESRFNVAVAGDRMYLLTNWEASNGRIMVADLRHPSRDQWKEVVPTSDTVIEDFALVGHRIFVNDLKNVASSVRVFDPDGKPEGEIDFPTIGTVGTFEGHWDQPEAFYTFRSFHVPRTIYRYDAASGARSEWWRSKVPINSDALELEQVWYPSKDGTKVPMFLVHKKGFKHDGAAPTYLTGYGGFLVNNTPEFSITAALWAEAGGLYALPNLRGGGEFGEAWHQAGMLDKKQNTFDDFIAAGEYLVAQKYTRPGKLSIEGGSNGGLLVGAAMTQRPDLFRAVVCDVPLLDMVRYHRFLVARFWVPEYGSSEDAAQFKTIYAYSPYQHVKKGTAYPAVMFVTGDSDTRVDPLHARKMTALMQASTGSDRPILLHYDTKLGHSGGKPVSQIIEDLTDEMMFLRWQLGMQPAAPAAPAARKSPARLSEANGSEATSAGKVETGAK